MSDAQNTPVTPSARENKMGTMPVNRLLLTMAIPMMLSMMVQAFYNVVDSYYVAQLSENALTAVSLVFPVQNLMISVASGIGVGMNALLSRALGQKKPKDASRFALQGVFLNICGFVLFFLIGLFLARPFMVSQTDIEDIVEYGVSYLTICCCCSFGLFGQITGERLLQSTGHTVEAMISQLVGAITNIILDPFFIFGIGFFPELGVAGAAVATVLGQCLGCCTVVFMNRTRNTEITFSLPDLFPQPAILKRILFIGFPSILTVSIGSVTTYVMNRILIGFTSTAVAVYGAFFKLNSFVFMPIFGMNNAMVPIIAYNYGARNKSRVQRTLLLALSYAFCLMCIGLAAFQLAPDKLLLIFDASSEMLAIGVPAFRTISFSFLCAGICIVCGSCCQALGYSIYSLITSFTRQVIVLMPAAYLLSLTGVLQNVWYAFLIAEVFAVTLSILLVRRVLRQIVW